MAEEQLGLCHPTCLGPGQALFFLPWPCLRQVMTGGRWRGLQRGWRAGEQPHGLAQPCCGCRGALWDPRVHGGAGVQGARHVRVQD